MTVGKKPFTFNFQMGKKKSALRQTQSSSASVQTLPDQESSDLYQVWLKVGLGFALIFALLLTYSNSFDGPFLLDNQQIITMDTRLTSFDADHLQAIFTKDYWWPTLASDLYRPITTFTYLLNYSVFGNEKHQEGYHWFNFILHVMNVWLVYAVLRQMGTKSLVAYWAAAIYGLHPVATEGVTNIVGRADLLVTLFVLSSLLCYIHGVKSRALVAKLAWFFGLFVLSVLGVLSKESGVMILPAMFFYDWLYRSQGDQAVLPKNIWDKIDVLWPGYLAILPALVTFVGCRYWMMTTSPTYGNPFVDNPIELAPFFSGRMTALKVLGQYCGMLIWPDRMSCDWSYNQIPLYGSDAPWDENIQSWIAIVLIISLFVLAWSARKKFPLITFGILWFAVAIFPTSNLPITIGSIKAERFLYLPFLGFALIAGMGLERVRQWISDRVQPRELSVQILSFVLPLAILAAFSVRTWYRNVDWETEYNLWSSAVKTCPFSFKTYKGFSNYYVSQGTEAGADQAINVAEHGVAILENPPLPIERQDNTLYINISFHYARKAELCMNRGAKDEAMIYFGKALGTLDKAMAVDHFANEASRKKFMKLGHKREDIRDVGNPTVYELRASVFLGMGRYKEAEEAAQYNLNLNPFSNRGNYLLGEIYARQNNYERAGISWMRQLLFDPANAAVWENLEKVYSIITPGQPAVRALENGGYTLLRDNPVARRDLNQACVETYELLLKTLRFEEAAKFRENAVTLYGCDAKDLPVPLRNPDAS